MLTKVKFLGKVCQSSLHRGEEAHIDSADDGDDEDSINLADVPEFHEKETSKRQPEEEEVVEPEQENQEDERVRDVEFELAEVRKLSRSLQKLRLLIERNEY